MSKILLIPNPLVGNLMTRHPAWFDRSRPLVAPGIALKHVGNSWVLYREKAGKPLATWTEAEGKLIALEDDITQANGISIFVESPQVFMEQLVERHKAPSTGDPLTPASVEGVDYFLVESGEVPADHDCDDGCEFFDAWEWTGRVQVNMPKARIIHMDAIREARNAELVKLDVPYLKALETGDTVEQDRIAALKQTLRDIPQTFQAVLDAKSTPETLKAARPTELV